MTERTTSQGFEIHCSKKGCRRKVVGSSDILFRRYVPDMAISIGYVKKGDYWLCGEHTHMTVDEIEKQYEKKMEGDEGE